MKEKEPSSRSVNRDGKKKKKKYIRESGIINKIRQRINFIKRDRFESTEESFSRTGFLFFLSFFFMNQFRRHVHGYGSSLPHTSRHGRDDARHRIRLRHAFAHRGCEMYFQSRVDNRPISSSIFPAYRIPSESWRKLPS
ncbi:hypothetical protein PUN28_009556 [Cardiocondyla obscurior]|uniref:Uncharacterized protein n=1 Tax=Cardiocondyla obscurior TaxID=286306 RepID=A0AAW2FYL2_9HYME